MLLAALKTGWGQALRQPRLVTIAWAWNLALAALGTLPVWAWLMAVSPASPEADRLLGGLNIGVLTELLQAAPGASAGIGVVTAAALGIALVSNAFLSGGIIHVLLGADDGERTLPRFLRGAGRYFGRFLRLLALSLVVGAAAVIAVSAVLGAIARPIASNGWEPGTVIAPAVVGIGAAIVVAYLVLVLDYARIRAVACDERRMVPIFGWAMRFVARRAVSTAAIGLAAAVVVLAALAAWLLLDARLSPSSGAAIALGLLVQQAVLFVRTGARVAQIGAEAAYYGWTTSRPPIPAAATVPWPAETRPAPQPTDTDPAGREPER